MKNKNLNMLIKASLSSRKLSTCFFCFFIIISAILILLSVGIILPLRDNIDNKINNHISNRELVTEFSEKISEDNIDNMLSEIKKVEHVSEVYRMPAKLRVTEESGVLFDEYNFGYVHNGSIPIITSGRTFDESETGVAIAPQSIKDFNPSDNKIHEIQGERLIGKTLILADECGNTHKAEVVGAYNTSDPIFSGDEILIPQADLLKYDDTVLKTSQGMGSISGDKSYIILIDSPKNVKAAMNEIMGINMVYQSSINVDADSYNTALFILIAALAFFIVLVMFGFFMFLKNDVNNRTDELALYRSLGYKSKHIFYIVFAEHLLFGIISLIAGVIITEMLNIFLVNPYLYAFLGNTFMEMTVTVTVWQIGCILLFFVFILIIVCRSAVKRSEKIDLTVLLREQ